MGITKKIIQYYKPIFDRSTVLRRCRKCHSDHPVIYSVSVNGNSSLLIFCPRKLKFDALSFEKGLDIPQVESWESVRRRENEKVLTLF